MPSSNLSARRAIACALILAGIGGCATSGPPPEQELAQAEQKVAAARQSNASEFAALELRTAEDKLEQARAAMDEEDYVTARRLAEAALADAQVAESKARSQSTVNAAEELSQSIETLRRESERAIDSGAQGSSDATQ